jgi:hypothetical protein
LIDGYQATALVYAAIKLGLPDRMASEAWTAEALAGETGLPASRLYRFLRALCAVGLCEESPNAVFSLSDAGRQLSASSASGLRERAILAVEQYWPAWVKLDLGIRQGQTPFEHAFGLSPWEFRRRNPESSEAFNAWLAKESRMAAAAVVEAIDFSGVDRVADIGGGGGGLLAAVLNARPGLEGILFDQPHVIHDAEATLRAAGCASRAELMGGDFFAEVPVRADLYLLKSIIHDWDDDRAGRILANCRAAMPEHARLLLIERVLPEQALQDVSTIMIDLHMLAVTGGRERSLAEFEALLGKARFSVSRVRPTPSGFSVIEAVPA